MRKKIELIMAVCLLISAFIVGRTIGAYASGDKIKEEKVVLLDPGHGGFDPGKIGVDKSKEKDLNLQIAKKIKKQLEKKKITVFLTREDDTGLYDEGSSNKKVQDMRRRVEIINEKKPQLVISIHQNSYSDSAVKGAQVFYYSHSKEAKEAAEVMQKALKNLEKENRREAKANATYYMLKKTQPPTIIVECGFLSNPEEAAKLSDEAYQEKLAKTICKGTIEYIGK